MNCAAHIVKYLLFIFNIAFVLCGVLLITIGSIMVSNLGDFDKVDYDSNIDVMPILVIILGCIVFIVAFFGCCGAIRENVCCTTTYAVFMLILFCLQIALVIWMLVERNDFVNNILDLLEKAWQQNDDAHGKPMDVFQVSFKCCGLQGFADYGNNPIPQSCCGSLSSSTQCTADVYASRPGCTEKVNDFWYTNADIVGYAGIGVALVELLAFTFACCLASSIRKSR